MTGRAFPGKDGTSARRVGRNFGGGGKLCGSTTKPEVFHGGASVCLNHTRIGRNREKLLRKIDRVLRADEKLFLNTAVSIRLGL